jgi:hypothetical protein
MFRNSIILLIYHCPKLLDLTGSEVGNTSSGFSQSFQANSDGVWMEWLHISIFSWPQH